MENNKTTAVTTMEKNLSDQVLNRVKDLEKENNLQFPANYSYANALKSAWLILQETQDKNHAPVLQSCSKESVANTLLNMVIQGLSPAKKQCYFVPYGGKLQLMRSYMGTIAVTKRLKGVKDVKAYCIYEGDEFETEFDLDTCTLKISKFNPKFENVDTTKIKGAFAVILGEKGPIHIELMNMAQIEKAWGMSRSYSKDSKVHNNFTDQMVKKTVINRACKLFANTSDDSDILIDAFNQAQSVDDDEKYDKSNLVDNVEYEVKEEIKKEANSKPIDIQPEEGNEEKKVVDVEPTPVEHKEHHKEEIQKQQTIINDDPGF
jgi:Recombinational DNA repair protein (RecE pathway)